MYEMLKRRLARYYDVRLRGDEVVALMTAVQNDIRSAGHDVPPQLDTAACIC